MEAPFSPARLTARAKVRAPTWIGGAALGSLSIMYVSGMILLPISALVWAIHGLGWSQFWAAVTFPPTLSAIVLTVALSAIVVTINAVFGTIVAWVLVRDSFPGKSIVNGVVDLPFALPTIVAGLTILVLYGSPYSPVGINLGGTRAIIGLALLFVTVPFVIRAVQPVLIAMDRDMEEAGAVLGASKLRVFRTIVFPNLAPALFSGVGLAFARALGEFGSVTLVASNLPGKTQVISLIIFADIQSIPLYPTEGAVAAALSVTLLTLSLCVLVVFNIVSHRLGRPENA